MLIGEQDVELTAEPGKASFREKLLAMTD